MVADTKKLTFMEHPLFHVFIGIFFRPGGRGGEIYDRYTLYDTLELFSKVWKLDETLCVIFKKKIEAPS